MKKHLFVSLFFALSLIFTGCASSYNSINPKTFAYSNNLTESNVDFSYRFAILRAKGNKKYAKKEERTGIKVIAVKITNNSGGDLILGENFNIFSGIRPLIPMEPAATYRHLKQGVAIYLLYLPLTVLRLNVYNNSSSGRNVRSYPIGYALGPGITIGNMIEASTSNKSLKTDLIVFDLANKKIANGETVYALISSENVGTTPLTLQLKGAE
ncbi:MAG: hypothetical protein V4714_12340 [Bacteroidota bacterium]